MFELTIFKSQYDNKTHRRVVVPTWDKFVELLRGLSKLQGYKGGPNSSPLITPAIFQDGATRSNVSTLRWGGWCAIDVDDHNLGDSVETLKEALHARFGQYNYLVYSTASSREDHLKFRLVFELDEAIERERIKPLWFAINRWVEELGDPQTKDMARMYYVPARYPNAYDFFFCNDGVAVNTSELIAKFPYKEKSRNSFLDQLSPHMRDAVIEHRKSQLNNTNITWTGYRDCPFWPKRLAVEYMSISDSGWYAKMYHIMVAIAGNAYSRQYPITESQIEQLCRQFDRENGNWYESRPMHVEAQSALKYIYENG